MPGRSTRPEATIGTFEVHAYTIPTDAPEADGTLSWNSTTLVVVEIEGGGSRGIGYTYSDGAVVGLILGKLAGSVAGSDAMNPQAAWRTMQGAVRNLGRSGLAQNAISAVDAALWDLKAKLLGLPLVSLLGGWRDEVEIYGSGGFTTYDDATLASQLAGWVEREGCRAVKMKVGSEPARDPARVAVARRAIGPAGLYVDANGAHGVAQAIAVGQRLAADHGVTWFEEPVSSDDVDGMCRVRAALPAPMELAAGEYAYDLDDVRRTLETGAVDVQQADATRIGGITGFLLAGALCEAHHVDLSGHCAPSLHLHVACAVPRFRNLEWFHDHVRIERMLFDGAPVPRDGRIRPDLTRSGLGLDLRHADAQRFRLD